MKDTVNIDVFVVAKETDTALSFLDRLALPHANVVLVDKAAQAIKNIKRKDYDLIVLGDRLEEGDTHSVALELKYTKNKTTPVVCVGFHKGRATKVLKAHSPYAFHAPGGENKVVVDRLVSYLANK